MFKNLTLQSKFYILSGSTALIFIIIYILLEVFISPIEENWEIFQKEVATRERELIYIKGEFGYGGAIHHFKNYILRKKPENYNRFQNNYKSVLKAIDEYKHIDHISEKEKKSLRTIEEIFGQYNDAIFIAKELIENGMGSADVDKNILINDKPAIEAFKFLEESTEKIIQEISERVSDSIVNMSIVLLISCIVALSVVALISWRIQHSVSKSLALVTLKMDQLSKGQLDQEDLDVATSDDIGRLSQIFNKLAVRFSLFMEISEKFLQGQTAKIDDDMQGEFGHSLIRMRKQAEEKKFAEETLREERDKLSQEDWLKSNLAEVSKSLQGLKNIEKFAKVLLDKLAPVLDAPAGAFYLKEKDEKGEHFLSLIGSHAYTQRKNISDRFKLREGQVGQCAYEKKPILLTKIPEDYIQISSGLGESTPKNIIDQPIVFEEELLAVIEFASFGEFSAKHMELLDQVSKTIGVIMKTISSSNQTEKLLIEAKAQSEALEQQSYELKTINEEMEEKANELKLSQNELKNEREELRATNEELEEKTEYLEAQKLENEIKSNELHVAKVGLEEKAKNLEKVSQYKSEFLANMSHELRTPLNSLLILSKDLTENSEGNLTKSQIEDANVIHSGGNELLNLINEILDLAKVEAGKLDVLMEKIKIEYITQGIRKQFESVAKKAGLEFSIELEQGIPAEIVIDEQRMSQILKNFLSNAMKFTSKGSVKLIVDWASPKAKFHRLGLVPSETLAFSVIDTGIGIPEAKQKAIFEAFQQEDGSTSRNYGGTGLGLTISKELASLMGGEIQLKSVQGKGSEFTLYLPINMTKTEDNTKGVEVQADPAKEIDTGFKESECVSEPFEIPVFVPDDRDSIQEKDKSLLIIEDDKSFVKILMKMAIKRGYKSLVAGDGRSGMQLALEKNPDAIILDLGLPDMDGLEVLERLKDNRKTQSIPVHIISARDNEKTAIDNGGIGFISKPASKDDLREVFEKLNQFSQNGKVIKEVLVVEDHKGSQVAIAKLLNSEKVKTFMVSQGMEALKLLESRTFDCMVLDLGLPDISGFELLDKISADKALPKPPVIIYTARELTEGENQQLRQYTNSIVIKGSSSPERLLSEVTLFLHTVSSSLPVARQIHTPMIREKNMALKDRKILLVDDDMRNTFALSKTLSKYGMNVILADNGKVALDKLQQDPDVDLVLMDIMMPVMDGYEAIKKIREQNQFSELPIIALTAKAMKGDRQKCIDIGANDYMAKPLNVDKLLTLMKVFLDARYEAH